MKARDEMYTTESVARWCVEEEEANAWRLLVAESEAPGASGAADADANPDPPDGADADANPDRPDGADGGPGGGSVGDATCATCEVERLGGATAADHVLGCRRRRRHGADANANPDPPDGADANANPDRRDGADANAKPDPDGDGADANVNLSPVIRPILRALAVRHEPLLCARALRALDDGGCTCHYVRAILTIWGRGILAPGQAEALVRDTDRALQEELRAQPIATGAGAAAPADDDIALLPADLATCEWSDDQMAAVGARLTGEHAATMRRLAASASKTAIDYDQQRGLMMPEISVGAPPKKRVVVPAQYMTDFYNEPHVLEQLVVPGEVDAPPGSRWKMFKHPITLRMPEHTTLPDCPAGWTGPSWSAGLFLKAAGRRFTVVEADGSETSVDAGCIVLQAKVVCWRHSHANRQFIAGHPAHVHIACSTNSAGALCRRTAPLDIVAGLRPPASMTASEAAKLRGPAGGAAEAVDDDDGTTSMTTSAATGTTARSNAFAFSQELGCCLQPGMHGTGLRGVLVDGEHGSAVQLWSPATTWMRHFCSKTGRKAIGRAGAGDGDSSDDDDGSGDPGDDDGGSGNPGDRGNDGSGDPAPSVAFIGSKRSRHEADAVQGVAKRARRATAAAGSRTTAVDSPKGTQLASPGKVGDGGPVVADTVMRTQKGKFVVVCSINDDGTVTGARVEPSTEPVMYNPRGQTTQSTFSAEPDAGTRLRKYQKGVVVLRRLGPALKKWTASRGAGAGGGGGGEGATGSTGGGGSAAGDGKGGAHSSGGEGGGRRGGRGGGTGDGGRGDSGGAPAVGEAAAAAAVAAGAAAVAAVKEAVGPALDSARAAAGSAEVSAREARAAVKEVVGAVAALAAGADARPRDKDDNVVNISKDVYDDLKEGFKAMGQVKGQKEMAGQIQARGCRNGSQ